MENKLLITMMTKWKRLLLYRKVNLRNFFCSDQHHPYNLFVSIREYSRSLVLHTYVKYYLNVVCLFVCLNFSYFVFFSFFCLLSFHLHFLNIQYKKNCSWKLQSRIVRHKEYETSKNYRLCIFTNERFTPEEIQRFV